MNLEPSGAIKPPTNGMPALSAAARILATICMAASFLESGMLFGVVMSDMMLKIVCPLLGLVGLFVIVLADPIFDR
mgnify:CR=1 FL=1